MAKLSFRRLSIAAGLLGAAACGSWSDLQSEPDARVAVVITDEEIWIEGGDKVAEVALGQDAGPLGG